MASSSLAGALYPVKRETTPTRCLLLCWEGDSLGCSGEIDELGGVFEDLFHFPVEKWKIPSEDPYFKVFDRVQEFHKKALGNKERMIIYYGGHGGVDMYQETIWSR